jgi:16S rRNA (guanine527-N7)-methyltransferase
MSLIVEYQKFSEKYNILLSNESIEKLKRLEYFVLLWNKKHNIISKRDEEILRSRHIFDGLIALKFFPNEIKESMDMGSGCGFPILPLAIARPNIQFTGIEPRLKRILIIKQFIRELKIPNITMIQGKAEDITHQKFSIITSRALGSFDEDFERCNPYMTSESNYITFKTENYVPTRSQECFEYQFTPEDKTYKLIKAKLS